MMIKSKRVKESRGVVCVEMVLKKNRKDGRIQGKENRDFTSNKLLLKIRLRV